MQTESKAAAADLKNYFATVNYAHADNLVLTDYGAGYAWLRSEEPAEDCDALFVPTQAGRDLCARWRAERALFGHEVSA